MGEGVGAGGLGDSLNNLSVIECYAVTIVDRGKMSFLRGRRKGLHC